MTNQSKFKITVAVTAFLILVILIYASHKYGFAFQYKWDAGSNGWTKSKYHKKKANVSNSVIPFTTNPYQILNYFLCCKKALSDHSSN